MLRNCTSTAPRRTATSRSASAVSADAERRSLTGIDVLARDGFEPLRGKRVGLVTNHTGRSRDGKTTIDLLHTAPGVKLVALFSPEHGIRGMLDDERAGRARREDRPADPLALRRHRRPTDAMLAGIDTLVVDLQDVGVRFYTYHATMGYVMEEAAKRKIAVVVLDRPNPINGWQIEGPTSGAGRTRHVHRLSARCRCATA